MGRSAFQQYRLSALRDSRSAVLRTLAHARAMRVVGRRVISRQQQQEIISAWEARLSDIDTWLRAAEM